MSTVLNEGGSPLRKPRQGVGPVIGRAPSRGTSAWSGSPRVRMRDGVDSKTVPTNDNRELSSRNFIRVDRGVDNLGTAFGTGWSSAGGDNFSSEPVIGTESRSSPDLFRQYLDRLKHCDIRCQHCPRYPGRSSSINVACRWWSGPARMWHCPGGGGPPRHEHALLVS
jgi:hypothetical protein